LDVDVDDAVRGMRNAWCWFVIISYVVTVHLVYNFS